MRPFLSLLAIVPSLFGLSPFAMAAPHVEHGKDVIHATDHHLRGKETIRTPHSNRHSHKKTVRAASCNTPTNRACWAPGFTINTDYEEEVPYTGVTRHYTLVLTEEADWKGPDGVVKSLVMLVNGTLPGPVLTADWGDMLQITVINNLLTNGTSIHWHGIRQLNTNLQDGVNGVTECPIPPGNSRVYTFLAEQYGTSWYHSHFSSQYGNGVVGSIQINGPASLPYDIDLGVFPVTDYYYNTSDWIVDFTKNNGPPASDNVLFNGTNIHPVTGEGSYAKVTLTPGKRHRLRIINISVENHFIFSLVGHTMTIIESDFVPVNAQTVDQLFVAIGQRYDVTIDASQEVDNYWFNATFVEGGPCGTSFNSYPAAIFQYEGAPDALPTVVGTTAAMDACSDLINHTPVVQRTVNVSEFVPGPEHQLNVSLDLTQAGQLFTWKINSTQMIINWEVPVDQLVMEGNTDYPTSSNVVTVNDPDQWIFWVVENDPVFAIPHPMHLHGHDFVILGRSDPTDPQPFKASDVYSLSGSNPTRRDVTMLPAKGWVVIAYKSDNPGTWLMHCHIAWHVSGGLAVNFLERPADLKAGIATADKSAFDDQCAAWNSYYPEHDPHKQSDSGLRKRGVSARPIGVGSIKM